MILSLTHPLTHSSQGSSEMVFCGFLRGTIKVTMDVIPKLVRDVLSGSSGVRIDEGTELLKKVSISSLLKSLLRIDC